MIRLCQLTLLLSSCWLLASTTTAQTLDAMIQPYRYPVQELQVDDSTKLAYIDVGQGEETLVFVHGLATYIPAWYPVIDRLSEHYRCIALDLPGYGLSSKDDYPGTMPYYAEVLQHLLQALDLQEVTLVGHSMGGQVVLSTALQEPAHLKQLILLAPAGFETFAPAQADWMKRLFTLETVMGADETQIRANWKLNFFEQPETVEFMIQDRLDMREAADFELYCQAVVRGMHGMLDGPVFDRLPEIDLPVLVVYGAEDQLIPNRYLNRQLSTQAVAEAGAAQLPDATLHLIPGCGHFITFDKPAEIGDLMLSFLTR